VAVLGSRQMEEVNYLYFENKSVPPLALLISGGRLSESSVPRIERFIEENLKGRANFHKILILEAEGGQGENLAKIELRPLTEAQQQDALFQVYDERNIDKVGGAFRLPRLLRGESKDFNRATAESALRFAEDQVFQPERDEFDYLINRKLLADMGIRFWRFRSQTPVTRDPERMTAMVEKLVRVGVLTPEEGRFLAGDIFNRELRKIGDDWTKRPITLTLAGIQTGVEDLRARTAKGSLLDDARRLLTLREELASEEARLADRRVDLARRYLEEGAERVPVPHDEFDTWFEPEARDDAGGSAFDAAREPVRGALCGTGSLGSHGPGERGGRDFRHFDRATRDALRRSHRPAAKAGAVCRRPAQVPHRARSPGSGDKTPSLAKRLKALCLRGVPGL